MHKLKSWIIYKNEGSLVFLQIHDRLLKIIVVAWSHLTRGLQERRNFVFEIPPLKIVWLWIQGSGTIFLRFVAKNVCLIINDSNTCLTLVLVKNITWGREWQRMDNWSKSTPDYIGSSPEKFLSGSKLKHKHSCFRLRIFVWYRKFLMSLRWIKLYWTKFKAQAEIHSVKYWFFNLISILCKAGSCWIHSSKWLGKSKCGKQNECREWRKEHVL